MLFYIQVTFVIEYSVQDKGGISISALMNQAKIRCVVVRDKMVELKRKIIECMTIAFLQYFTV